MSATHTELFLRDVVGILPMVFDCVIERIREDVTGITIKLHLRIRDPRIRIAADGVQICVDIVVTGRLIIVGAAASITDVVLVAGICQWCFAPTLRNDVA